MTEPANYPTILSLFNPGELERPNSPIVLTAKEIWRAIFRFLSIQDLFKYKVVSKSWNFVCTDVINFKLQKYANRVAIRNGEVYAKWEACERSQAKSADWETIFKRECLIDRQLTQVREASFEVEYELSQGEIFKIFLCGNCLVVSFFPKSIQYSDLICVDAFAVKERNQIPSIFDVFDTRKINENSFITVTDHKVQLFRFINSNKKTEIKEIKIQSVLSEVYCDEKMFVNYNYNFSRKILSLDLYEWETLERSNIQFHASEAFSLEIKKITDNYVVGLDLCSMSCFIFSRKIDYYHYSKHKFLMLQEEMALFHDSEKKAILQLDLSVSTPMFVKLFDLEECLSFYMTKTFYYFVGQNRLHIYSLKEKQTKSFNLLNEGQESVTKVIEFQFIRVTSELLLFVQKKEINHTINQEIVLCNMKQLFSSNKLINLWKGLNSEGQLYCNDDLIVFSHLKHNIWDRFKIQIKTYELGLSVKGLKKAANVATVSFKDDEEEE